jgi:hypothetical protein
MKITADVSMKQVFDRLLDIYWERQARYLMADDANTSNYWYAKYQLAAEIWERMDYQFPRASGLVRTIFLYDKQEVKNEGKH